MNNFRLEMEREENRQELISTNSEGRGDIICIFVSPASKSAPLSQAVCEIDYRPIPIFPPPTLSRMGPI